MLFSGLVLCVDAHPHAGPGAARERDPKGLVERCNNIVLPSEHVHTADRWVVAVSTPYNIVREPRGAQVQVFIPGNLLV